ncbi:MAG: hypothetical protein N838_25895 [Thiohalocapsa sp. PB-PSB1]|nr:MAG: hypothetical protein N838_25895 [Thiohalocapsa sp. PB-PSB1]
MRWDDLSIGIDWPIADPLLTGGTGQLGFELSQCLSVYADLICPTRGQLDLADTSSIRPFVERTRPDLIVNAAAYTAVDKAESEPDLAMQINVVAVGELAQVSAGVGVPLIHFSTDYVFDGSGRTPWKEDDGTGPLNVYGQTKLSGEPAIVEAGVPHLIFRTAWVYGLRGHNFVKTMLKLGQERERLSIVDDQLGAPTSARFIADAVALILAQHRDDWRRLFADHSGLYHLICGGEVSWYGPAKAIFELVEKQGPLFLKHLEAIPSEQYPTPAQRPRNSRLDCSRVEETFAVEPVDWRQALVNFMSSCR